MWDRPGKGILPQELGMRGTGGMEYGLTPLSSAEGAGGLARGRSKPSTQLWSCCCLSLHPTDTLLPMYPPFNAPFPEPL